MGDLDHIDEYEAEIATLRAEIMRLSVENKTWVARFNVVKERCDPECVHCAAWRSARAALAGKETP